jgi:hypothetical protein
VRIPPHSILVLKVFDLSRAKIQRRAISAPASTFAVAGAGMAAMP